MEAHPLTGLGSTLSHRDGRIVELDADTLTLIIVMIATVFWAVQRARDELQPGPSQRLQKLPAEFRDGEHPDGVSAGASDLMPDATGGGLQHRDLARRLNDLSVVDGSFDAERFLESVRLVYEAVVLAYANGDRELLRDLLSTEVYETFVQAIEAREARSARVSLHFIALKQAEIVDADIFNMRMQIAVGFEGEIVSSTYDGADRLVDGDPTATITVTDRWTFAKGLTSSRPVWKLIATEPAEDSDLRSLRMSSPEPTDDVVDPARQRPALDAGRNASRMDTGHAQRDP